MRHLAAQPVRRVAVPAYPTKLDVLAEPELLARHVPPAWLAKAEVAGALSAFLAVNTVGCTDRPIVPKARTNPRLANAAIVAPVFEHGAGQAPGRGVMGCVAVASPVFLSEEEALQVIHDELTKYGLEASQRGVLLKSVKIEGRRPTDECNWLTDQRKRDMAKVVEPLEVDLIDPKRKVAVEYIAATDFDPLGGDEPDGEMMSIRAVAKSVAACVQSQGKGVYFGAFYDPVVYMKHDLIKWPSSERPRTGDAKADREALDRAFEDAWEKAEDDTRTESKRLLREQVKDFADWLKGQGVI
jgi:hypothetical protein